MVYDYKSLRGHNVIQIGDDILSNKKPYDAPFKVIKLDQKRNNIVVSRRELLEESLKGY